MDAEIILKFRAQRNISQRSAFGPCTCKARDPGTGQGSNYTLKSLKVLCKNVGRLCNFLFAGVTLEKHFWNN